MIIKSLIKTTAAAALLFAVAPSAPAFSLDKLSEIIAGRSDAEKARDQYRHPEETLRLFGIEEGMTVIDALPGSWYGNILAELLGPDGRYIGVRYGEWRAKIRHGDDWKEKWAKEKANHEAWPAKAAAYGDGAGSPKAEAYFFPGMPASLDASADAWLFFRALHHTNRYDPKYLDMTAADAFRVLKSGGVAGVVQHRAKEDRDEAWANGSNGYLKQSRVVEAFTKAGFVLETESEINANPKDQANVGDTVWRLPPANKKNPETLAIGESDRMTLVFRKP